MSTPDTHVDITYKRLATKHQYTSTLKKWHEEFPGKPLTIKLRDLWVDDIPATPPLATTSVVEVVDHLVLTEDVTVDNSLSWLACAYQGDLSTRLGDFIQPDQQLMQGYYVRLFDSNGTQIYVGDPVNWEFDYPNGVLTFENRPTAYVPPFSVSCYRYVGTVGSFDSFAPTLDRAYDGPSGEGAGRIINVDFGPVALNATNGSAALQLSPVEYTPTFGLADGQIVNKAGILYVYDGSRQKWLSMQRQNVVFGAKRADGMYLNLSDFTSNMSGWPALRDGTILGLTAQSSGGCPNKQFKLLRHGNQTPLLSFSLSSYAYVNGALNIDFQGGELIKILASSELGTALNTIINVEIGWRI